MLNREKAHISTADKAELKGDVIALVEPLVSGHGAELVDIELSGGRGNELVRILVYKDPGITLDLCVSISREIADLFDIEDPMPGRYRLEVTSPGLDRPLSSDGDFTRASGRLLKIVLKSGQTIKGRLTSWETNRLFLENTGKSLEVVRAEIAKALIEAEF